MLFRSKHDGSLPIVGVNTFRNPDADAIAPTPRELVRGTADERRRQLDRLAEFHAVHADRRAAALERLTAAALDGDNVFAVLMDAVRCCSLGEITQALFDVGGRYRRAV